MKGKQQLRMEITLRSSFNYLQTTSDQRLCPLGTPEKWDRGSFTSSAALLFTQWQLKRLSPPWCHIGIQSLPAPDWQPPSKLLEFSLEIRAKHVDIEDIDRRRGRVLHKIRSMNLHQQWPCWGSPSHQQPCSKNQPNPTFKLFLFFDLQPVEFLRFTVIIVYM